MFVTRRVAPMLALALLVALAAVFAGRPLNIAEAQTQLTLADFDASGLDVEVLVLISTSSSLTQGQLWARGRFGSQGTLLDGGTGGVIPMLSDPAHPNDPAITDGNLVRIGWGSIVVLNDDGGLSLADYFGTNGAGNDLRLYFQSADDGVGSSPINGALSISGTNYVNITMNNATSNVLTGIGGGERFIFALARLTEAPGQVTNLSATVGHTYVRLDWSAPTGGGAVTHYEYSTDSGATWTSTGSTGTSHTVTSLTNGTEYSFTVRASNNAGGSGAPSAARTVTPTGAPGQVTGLVVDEVGDRAVTLSWAAPADNDNAVTRYEYSTFPLWLGFWASTGSTATTYTVTTTSARYARPLVNGDSYNFLIRAVNGNGTGPASTGVNATPVEAAITPGAPTSLVATRGNAFVDLDWVAPNNDGGTPITEYQYSSDGGGNWTDTNSSTTAFRVTRLINGQSYTFRVRAVNGIGAGIPSSSQTATPAKTPEAPTDLQGSAGNFQVALSWTAPADGGDAITGYQYSSDGGGTWRSTGSTSTSYTVTQTSSDPPNNLNNDTLYVFLVRARNSLDTGAHSSSVPARPLNQPPTFAADIATRSVDESQLAGQNVGAPITATDPESDVITYSITGANPAGFTVTSGGQIQTGQVLDYETGASYTMTLRAEATGGNDTITVTVSVNDVNEAPSFAQDSYTRSVAENSDGGTNVGLPIAATDPDRGDSLTYTLPTDAGKFSVDATGQITVNAGAGLDHESTASYSITIRATDTGGAAATVGVTVSVTGVNEAPAFAAATATRNVDENSPSGTDLGGPLTATDPDSEDTLTYSLIDDFGQFTISSAGQLEVGTGAALDYEDTEGYVLTVRGTDAAGLYDEVAVTVSVNDVNEAPSFAQDSYTRSVAENSDGGTNVGGPLTATDPDSGDSLTYTLPTDAGKFSVDATGQITVNAGAGLDHESTASYSITIRATDTGGAAATVGVTVSVTGVNEAPAFAADTATRDVDENSPSGTDLGGPLTATDPDSGDTLTYSLVDDFGQFNISSAGQVEVGTGAALDYEDAEGYALTVRGTDAAGLYGEVAVTVSVNDVNEAPSFAQDSYTRSVAENSDGGTNVGLPIAATDPDRGDSLTYTLPTDAGKFSVDATGQITVNAGAGLDHESTASYSITIRATDTGGAAATVGVTVSVTNRNESPTFAALTYRRGVAEDADQGDLLGAAITATNPDALALTYSLSGTGAFSFAVSASGQVSVSANAALDHEAATSYSLTIQAASSDAGTAAASLFITVTDVDEPPFFSDTTVSSTIAETDVAGDNVGSPVTATDPEGRSITYSLSGADAAHFRIDGATGQVTIGPGVTLAPAVKPTYSVSVVATDPGGNSDTVSLTVGVKDVREAVLASKATVGPAYLGTIHLVVGNDGTWYGYQENGYGGFTTGRLPALLFVDYLDRPATMAAVNTGTNQLRLSYADTETGLLRIGQALQWIRLQVRSVDNTILAEGNLWDASSCVVRTLCVTLNANIDSQTTKAVAIDFFDAAAEVLEASSGGVMSILFMPEATDTDVTGFNTTSGGHIAGHIPAGWMLDGEERDIQELVVNHSSTDANRVVELHYSAASPVGQWRSTPEEMRRWRLTLRDRRGDRLLQVRLRDALAAMTPAQRRCGDSTPQRRLCIRYDDAEVDLTAYRGQVLLVQLEDLVGISLIERVPGGGIGGQIMLILFGGIMGGYATRRFRTPVREIMILAFMSGAGLILPFMGIGNLFWTGGVLVLVGLAVAAVFFIRSK